MVGRVSNRCAHRDVEFADLFNIRRIPLKRDNCKFDMDIKLQL